MSGYFLGKMFSPSDFYCWGCLCLTWIFNFENQSSLVPASLYKDVVVVVYCRHAGSLLYGDARRGVWFPVKSELLTNDFLVLLCLLLGEGRGGGCEMQWSIEVMTFWRMSIFGTIFFSSAVSWLFSPVRLCSCMWVTWLIIWHDRDSPDRHLSDRQCIMNLFFVLYVPLFLFFYVMIGVMHNNIIISWNVVQTRRVLFYIIEIILKILFIINYIWKIFKVPEIGFNLRISLFWR